jgi:hypothetical protein
MKLIAKILGRTAAPTPAQVQAARSARYSARNREDLINALVDDTTGYQLSAAVPDRNGIMAEVVRRRAARR